MKVSYFRAMREHHLVISSGERKCPEYQLEMLTYNAIRGLLTPSVQVADGETLYDYTITGLRSLQSCVEETPLSAKTLGTLMRHLCGLMEELERYLLDGDYLAIRPEFIFLKKTEEEIDNVYCCFFPFQAEEPENQLRELLKYILNEVDYQEKRAVDLAYSLFQESVQEGFSANLRQKIDAMETPEPITPEVIEAKEDKFPLLLRAERPEISASRKGAFLGGAGPSGNEEILWAEDSVANRRSKRKKRPSFLPLK